MAQPLLNRPLNIRLPRAQLAVVSGAAVVAASGAVCLFVSPFVGSAAFDTLWGVEPLGYIGAVLLIVGLAIVAIGLAATTLGQAALAAAERNGRERSGEEQSDQWREVTMGFSASSITISADPSGVSRADSGNCGRHSGHQVRRQTPR